MNSTCRLVTLLLSLTVEAKKLLTHFWVNGTEVTVVCILRDVDVVVALVFTCR